MHKNVKKFTNHGWVDDSAVVRLRDEQDHLLKEKMKDKGYIPVFGMGPYLALEYDFKEEKQAFTATAYGVFVGSKGVSKWMGVDLDNGRYLERPTAPST